jgi:hypothetical protein
MESLWRKMSQKDRSKIKPINEQKAFLIDTLQRKVAWSDLKVFELMQLFEALEINEFNFINPLDQIFYGKK